MAFSFEPFLAIPAGHFMAVSAGPEHAGLPLAIIVFLIMYSAFVMLREDYVRHSETPFFTDYDLGRKSDR